MAGSTRPHGRTHQAAIQCGRALGVANSNEIGYRHVMQALQRVQPGGRLVAILGGGREGWTAGSTMDPPGAQDFWRKVRDGAE